MQENDIPKQYDPTAAQEKWSQFWDEKGLFRPDGKSRNGAQRNDGDKPPFCIVIPPPNVTGALHMGHALNNTLQDITIRMKRMQGYDTLWLPGVDHAGIATQAVVERKLFEEEKKTRHDIGREALVQRIWDWKEQYQARIIQQLKGMGCSCDWSRTRFTLDDMCAKAVRHFFFKLFEQKLIYRGKRLVNWDTHLQTAVSDDEVFHETVAGGFWYIRYEIADDRQQTAERDLQERERKLQEAEEGLQTAESGLKNAQSEFQALNRKKKRTAEYRELIATYRKQIAVYREIIAIYPEMIANLKDTISVSKRLITLTPYSVVVATTRPETMLGDTAVAVHPDPEAALNKAIDDLKKRIATAPEKEKEDLQKELDAIELRKTDGTLDWLKALVEMAKEGVHVTLPLLNKKIPLLLDEWAKPEKGTGCVKITPAHDPNDYEVGLRHGLPMVNILNKDGTLNENAEQYAGLPLKKAREKIAADLETAGLLVKFEEREIELAHSDRSKTPIEPFLNDQWFVKMDELAQAAIDAVDITSPLLGERARVRGGAPADSTSPHPNPLPEGEGTLNDKVRIYPHRYTKGYIDWLSEKRDWPIGRQLWWGHRIPIWYCEGATEEELQKAFAGRNDVIWQWSSEGNVWWICSQTEDLAADAVPGHTLVQEEDVLDTWFSSALWPHSTLGWPDDTEDLQRYYPTGVLITSRDILSLWVARMVLAGLFNTGQKPFHEVYIHPKILDKYGEGMSKSKGNGVDPISVMNKFGADALRFALAYLTTENQDIRLPLDFECPHCGVVVEQTKKNRMLPKIPCPKCQKDFRTQWAATPEDKALPEGLVVGERFEVARNFCNKLWNAARFVLMSLEERKSGGHKPAGGTTEESLGTSPAGLRPPLLRHIEDQWILSRLATVTKNVTESLESYHYADAMRWLYDFTWDEFCSFYVEIVKSRLNNETQRDDAQFMLFLVLNTLVRLLHPVVPFVTEEIWQHLQERCPDMVEGESIVVAKWPGVYKKAINPEVEKQFAIFQELLRAVRDVRASRNVPPKTEIAFSVRCDEATAELLKPMEPYFLSMARARATAWGPATQSPPLASVVPLMGMDVYVDISDLIDVPAEIAKLEKEIAKLEGFIQSKESKLNSDFVQKAPPAVVEKERQSLEELRSQYRSAMAALGQLKQNRDR